MINIQTANMPEVRAQIARLKAKLRDTKKVHAKISIMFDAWVQRNFKSEGGNVGGWDKFAAGGRYSGKGASRKFDPSAKLLQDTGRLRASFIPFATRRNAGIGSELPYSKAHDKGEGVPRRRILMELPEVKHNIIKKYDVHVKESIA